MKGFHVRLCGAPQSEILQTTKKEGGIEISGAAGCGFAAISEVTTSVEEAIKSVDVVMIDPLREPIEPLIRPCISSIENGQMIVFTSGYYWALEFYNRLTEVRKDANVPISEMSIGPPAGMNLVKPNKLSIGGWKKELRLASIPSERTDEIIGTLHEAYPQLLAFKNVLETTLNNPNHIIHAPILMLNAGRIELTRADFPLFIEGGTPSVIRVMEAFDRERLSVTEALGLQSISVKEWLLRLYEAKGDSLYETIQNCEAYQTSRQWQVGKQGILSTDIPRALAPLSSLASYLGLSTPVTDMQIELLSMLYQVDYRKRRLTLDKLGLAGMNKDEMIDFVTSGAIDR